MSWFGEDAPRRKSEWPVWDYMFKYFPLAFLEEVRVAVLGNKQHNAGQPLHWARGKSMDQLNTALRHLFDYAKAKADGVTVPRDAKGSAALAQAIWRLKAQLQLDLEEEAKENQAIVDPVFDSVAPGEMLGVLGGTYGEMVAATQPSKTRCKCGAKAFTTNPGDLPPTVVYPGEGTHSPNGCFSDAR